MNILIDECLNWRLSRALPGHHAVSVKKMGWNAIKNGQLLGMAVQHGFEVFITGDRNLGYQQNTMQFPIALVVLEAKSTQLHDTLPLMPKVLSLLTTLKPYQIVKIAP